MNQWTSDDAASTDEDNNPWDANGHVYGTDNIEATPLTTDEAFILKFNFREYVNILGVMASDYMDWRNFRSIAKNGAGVWGEETTYGNVI